MEYIPVHLYSSVRKLRDVRDFLTQTGTQNDRVTIATMVKLIDVTIRRIHDIDTIPPRAVAIIESMDPNNISSLSIKLYNLQTHLCA